MPTLTTCLWFDDQALAAAEFYVSVFPDSEITDVSRIGPAVASPDDLSGCDQRARPPTTGEPTCARTSSTGRRPTGASRSGGRWSSPTSCPGS
ncbi:MAG: VOC family protein [Actinomycetota bacterium]